MRQWISGLTLNQKLALAAILLGVIAIGAVPTPGGRVTLDARELALTIARDADTVDPTELAGWIIEQRADYRLIDLRSDGQAAPYRIPGAMIVPMAGLTGAGLGRQEKLVLYADDVVHAAQAWMLLKARGYAGVYILKGGLDAWNTQVLFPAIADNPTGEQRRQDDKRRAVSAFFGGRPRSADAVAANGAAVPSLPAIAPSSAAPPPSVVPPQGPKVAAKGPVKKKEGC